MGEHQRETQSSGDGFGDCRWPNRLNCEFPVQARAGLSLGAATTTLLADLEISPPGSCLEDDLREAITRWACSAEQWIEERAALELALHISAHLSSQGWMLADWSSGEVRAFARSDALDLAETSVLRLFDLQRLETD